MSDKKMAQNPDGSWSPELTWPIQQKSYHCYDIEVLGIDGKRYEGPGRNEIIKAFKEEVGMSTEAVDCIQVNKSTFLVAKTEEDWARKFSACVETVLSAEGAPSGEWFKNFKGSASSGTLKEWLKVDKVKEFADPSSRVERGETKAIVKHLNDKKAEFVSSGNTYPRSVVHIGLVFARRGEVTIQDLLSMGCWSTSREGDYLRQIEATWAAAQVSSWYKDEQGITDPVILGNRVFGPSTDLGCGVQRRSGYKLSLVLIDTDDPETSAQIQGNKCDQLFYKAGQVSDFIVEYYGGRTSFDSNDTATLKSISELLKGVRVVRAYSKDAKPHVMQGVDARTPDQITILRLGAVPANVNIAEMFTETHGRPLRYPGLPCVDFGTMRHFYFPAEACKILPGQPFSHLTPILVDDAAFRLRQLKVKDTAKQASKLAPRGNTFDDNTGKAFTICFAEVVVLPDGVNASEAATHQIMTGAVWKRFRHEIGQRFGQQLEAMVKQGQPVVVLPFRPGEDVVEDWAELLTRPLRSTTDGIKKVLIASIPGGTENQAIHFALRKLCDTTLGVQCSIVTAKEVLKRALPRNAPDFEDMVKFTGAIVRDVFARALVPGKIDPRFQESQAFVNHYGRNEKVRYTGTLMGIHVQDLHGVVNAQGLRDAAGEQLLVTITSFTASDEKDESICTTHHLISLLHATLQAKVASCVETHFRRKEDQPDHLSGVDMTEADDLVYFRSGYACHDRVRMCSEVESLPYYGKEPKYSNRRSVYMTYVEQPTAIVADGSSPVAKDEVNCMATPVTTNEKSKKQHFQTAIGRIESETCKQEASPGNVLTRIGATDDLADPFKLNRALQTVYSRRQSNVQNGGKTYLVTHCSTKIRDGEELLKRFRNDVKTAKIQASGHIMSAFSSKFDTSEVATEPKNASMWIHTFHSLLKNATVPDMMYLTQKANRRALKYVEIGAGLDVDDEKIMFTMTPICSELSETLYFL
ncbi:hypothetical protein LTR09_011153 [Extremus antarcticus]|uniref:PAZ domain-containing protein n=1 Tax=Extremus antarcticus TaxID=702011 RepID=A0AAJ0D6S2_9PEZI|nr:hypothetical protein LTR09_011153 [Extremus antarcticus]